MTSAALGDAVETIALDLSTGQVIAFPVAAAAGSGLVGTAVLSETAVGLR